MLSPVLQTTIQITTIFHNLTIHIERERGVEYISRIYIFSIQVYHKLKFIAKHGNYYTLSNSIILPIIQQIRMLHPYIVKNKMKTSIQSSKIQS